MDPAAALREHFGFAAFRPGQREAVDAALADRDVLVVMPTGAGKSLCYQLPGLIRDDLTIVVSPLVSLMQDQVSALDARVPGRVALVNAQQDAGVNRDVLDRAASGELRLLYVAPERFSSPVFVDRMKAARVGLFVVDEAHCVSEWGHDFRPDYFRLADAARYLGAKAIVASTATATPQVSADIVKRLGLRDVVRVTTGFDRPNLSFAVVPCKSAAATRKGLIAALSREGALPAIVYAGTRKACDDLAGRLETALGQEVLVYHAGLGRADRAQAQERFMGGEVDVVVATNAFGMGVDKADVRTVAHAAVPGSLEAYYQEAGRAGRDGAPARALLFAEQRAKGLHVFFIERTAADESRAEAVARRLERRAKGGRYDLGMQELAAVAGGEVDGVRSAIGHLVQAGVVQPAPAPPDRASGRLSAPFDGRARAFCRSLAHEARRARWKQYRAVWAFVEGDGCRRESILRHFGDHAPPVADEGVPCCDVCDAALREEVLAPIAMPARRTSPATPGGGGSVSVLVDGDLDSAILEIVGHAEPSVGRTRAVEILRGGLSRVIRDYAYDGLPGYGAYAHLSKDEVLGRVDELLTSGTLRSTGGRFPKLARV
jgi:ATP-dependent DNA helicase RecQ